MSVSSAIYLFFQYLCRQNRNLQPQLPKIQQKTELPTTSSQRYLLSLSTTRELRSILATFPKRTARIIKMIATTLKPLWNHPETTLKPPPSTRCPLRGLGLSKNRFSVGLHTVAIKGRAYVAKTKSNPELTNVCFFSHLPLFFNIFVDNPMGRAWSGPEIIRN